MRSTSPALPPPSSNATLLTLGLLLLSVVAAVGLFYIGRAELLRIIYPALAVGVGGLLYAYRPPAYLAFMLWTWFLTPAIRRIIDYQAGFESVNLVMLTPLLVTGFTVFSLLRHRHQLLNRTYLPFTLVLVAITYAYGVGIWKNGPFASTFALTTWMIPPLLGLHIVLTWRQYPAYRESFKRTFLLAALLLGGYGIVQYLVAPPWDAQWMIDSGLTSIGHPEPRSIRVFGTLNISGVYAMTMMAAALVLISHSSPLSRIAFVPALAGLLLSLVRAAWGGFVIGLIIIFIRATGKLRTRLLIVIGIMAVLGLPLSQAGFIQEAVAPRMETLGNLEEEGSFEARSNFYSNFGKTALTTPIGNGIGGTGKASKLKDGKARVFDSGLMGVPYELGWPGAFLYVSGLIGIWLTLLRSSAVRTDLFALVCMGIAGAIIAMLVFNNHLVGVKGILIWSFMALGLAAVQYYEHLPPGGDGSARPAPPIEARRPARVTTP